jgi:hypothetical protein
VCGTSLVALLLSVVFATGLCRAGASTAAAPAGADARHGDDTNAAPGAGRKYHPGHYVDLLRYQVLSDDDRYLIPALKPGVAGVQMRYLWRDLETGRDRYDFSRIESDLKLLADRKVQLIVVVADKSYKNEQPVPDYLAGYTLPNGKGGHTLQRWNPYVVERWVKLMQALGERFDSHPNFEGVATEESAPTLDESELKRGGYTPEKYRDALIEMLRRAAQAMPGSRVFWYMNFLPHGQHYIAQIASAVAPYGVVMGGPDVLPDSPPLKRLVYPIYRQFQGRMPLFCSVMPNSYRHLHKGNSPAKYWTMEELYEFARDELHVNYLLWTYVARPKPADAYDIDDAFPVIERHPVINPERPE